MRSCLRVCVRSWAWVGPWPHGGEFVHRHAGCGSGPRQRMRRNQHPKGGGCKWKNMGDVKQSHAGVGGCKATSCGFSDSAAPALAAVRDAAGRLAVVPGPALPPMPVIGLLVWLVAVRGRAWRWPWPLYRSVHLLSRVMLSVFGVVVNRVVMPIAAAVMPVLAITAAWRIWHLDGISTPFWLNRVEPLSGLMPN